MGGQIEVRDYIGSQLFRWSNGQMRITRAIYNWLELEPAWNDELRIDLKSFGSNCSRYQIYALHVVVLHLRICPLLLLLLLTHQIRAGLASRFVSFHLVSFRSHLLCLFFFSCSFSHYQTSSTIHSLIASLVSRELETHRHNKTSNEKASSNSNLATRST